jgi:phage gp16-like protein
MKAPATEVRDGKRRAELGKIHIATRALGLIDDDYRAFLKRVTGRESAGELDARQRGIVLDELRRLGFRSPRTLENTGRPGEPQERLAIALWRDLGRLGVLEDPSDKRLRKFAAKLTQFDSMKWAPAAAMNKTVEALKAWRKREYDRADRKAE